MGWLALLSAAAAKETHTAHARGIRGLINMRSQQEISSGRVLPVNDQVVPYAHGMPSLSFSSTPDRVAGRKVKSRLVIHHR